MAILLRPLLEFDLVLMDEASQIQPVDALGAIARANQMVVVGDERQLPPTTFFAGISGNADSELTDDEETQAGDMESILGLCDAQGVPSRMLRWHYRSRHHSLIAVSNHEKVVAAIDAARIALPSRARDSHGGSENTASAETDETETPPAATPIERHHANGEGAPAMQSLSQPYIEASFPVDRTYEIHELPIGSLSLVVVEIVKVEGPIHQDEIARRVTQLWSHSRTGRRISAAVENAIEEAESLGQLTRNGLFWSVPNQQTTPIRDRSNVMSKTVRKTEHVPPAEIRAALVTVISTYVGVNEQEAIVTVAKLMGLGTKTASFKETARDEIRMLLDAEVCELRNGRIYEAELPVLKVVN